MARLHFGFRTGVTHTHFMIHAVYNKVIY